MEDTGPLTYGTERGEDDAAESVDGLLREIAAAPHVNPSSAPEEGELVGGSFRIERMLGEGGMGVVFLAHDEELDRPVALKLQRSHRTERVVQRLAREARAMARVTHPNVVPVHEVGEHRGRVFIAMEYVDGGTARDWVTAQPRTWQEIVELYAGAGRGLAAAHAIGLVHRDFKPDNVLVGRDGRPRVADFGLARPVATGSVASGTESSEAPTSTGSSRSSSRSGSLHDRLTMTGAAVGTAQYMAPEQHGTGDVDARADQFSFCVALYEALAGRRPFTGRTAAKLLHNIHLGRIRPPKEDRRIPPHVLAALRRGLSADPNDRFPSMDALLSRLVRKPSSRWRWVASVSALALAGGFGAFATRGAEQDPCDAGSHRLEQVWSEQTRVEIQRMVDGIGKAYATDAWERSVEPLSEYARVWGEAYREACEATQVRHEQPVTMLHKRMACLDERRHAFTRLVDRLRALDPATAIRMHDSVRGLPRVERCSDLEALERSEDLPADASQREAVVRLEQERAAVRALDPSTSAEKMLTEFDRMLQEAEAIGYRPLIGRLRVNKAEALYMLGQSDDDGLPRQAFHDALASGDNDLALRAVSVLVRFHAGRRSAEAHTWAQTGRALLTKVDDPLAGFGLMRAEAIAYAVERRYDEAIPLFEEMVEQILERAPHHHNLPIAYADLGKTYAKQGNLADAERWLRKAKEAVLQEHGPHHPNVAEYTADLARLRLYVGDFEEARALLEEAVRILSDAYGPDHANVAHMNFDLADVYSRLGDTQGALEILVPAVEILRHAVGEERLIRIEAETTHAWILAKEGRHAEARAMLDRLLAEQAGPDADPVSLAATLNALAALEQLRGDCAAALEHARRALDVAEGSGVDFNIATALVTIADCTLELGRSAEAIASFERVIDLLAKSGRSPVTLARARLGLARALRDDPGQSERVQTLLAQVLPFLEGRRDTESIELLAAAHDLAGR